MNMRFIRISALFFFPAALSHFFKDKNRLDLLMLNWERLINDNNQALNKG